MSEGNCVRCDNGMGWDEAEMDEKGKHSCAKCFRAYVDSGSYSKMKFPAWAARNPIAPSSPEQPSVHSQMAALHQQQGLAARSQALMGSQRQSAQQQPVAAPSQNPWMADWVALRSERDTLQASCFAHERRGRELEAELARHKRATVQVDLAKERDQLRSELGDTRGERDTWQRRAERAEAALDLALKRGRR